MRVLAACQRLLRLLRDHRQEGADRQRIGLPVTPVRRHPRPHHAQADPALPATDQRQRRTVQPHPGTRVGLRPPLPHRERGCGRVPGLPPHLQSPPRPHHAPRRRQPTAFPTPPGSTPRSPGPATSNACSGPTTSGPVQEKRYTQMPPGESLWGCQRSAPIASTCREEAVAHPGSPLLSSVPCVARRAVAIRDRCDRVGHRSRPRARRGSWGRVRAGTSATMGDGSARGCEHSTPGGRREPNPSRRPTRRRPHSISDGPTTIGIGLGLAEESRRVLPVLIARPGPVRTALVGRTCGRPVLSVSCDGSARCRSGLRDVGGGRAESCDRALDRAFHGTRIQAADVRHHQRRLVESCPGAENCHR